MQGNVWPKSFKSFQEKWQKVYLTKEIASFYHKLYFLLNIFTISIACGQNCMKNSKSNKGSDLFNSRLM